MSWGYPGARGASWGNQSSVLSSQKQLKLSLSGLGLSKTLLNLVHSCSEPGWLLAWRPVCGGEVSETHSKSGFTKILRFVCLFVFNKKCGVTLILRLPENPLMGDCKTAPWAWSPFAALVGLWVLHQEQQYLGGEKLLPSMQAPLVSASGAFPQEEAWPVRWSFTGIS